MCYAAHCWCRPGSSFQVAVLGDLHLSPEEAPLFSSARAHMLQYMTDASGKPLPGAQGFPSLWLLVMGLNMWAVKLMPSFKQGTKAERDRDLRPGKGRQPGIF